MKKKYKIFEVVENNQDFKSRGPLQTHSLTEPWWAHLWYDTEKEAEEHLYNYCEEFTQYTILSVYLAD